MMSSMLSTMTCQMRLRSLYIELVEQDVLGMKARLQLSSRKEKTIRLLGQNSVGCKYFLLVCVS